MVTGVVEGPVGRVHVGEGEEEEERLALVGGPSADTVRDKLIPAVHHPPTDVLHIDQRHLEHGGVVVEEARVLCNTNVYGNARVMRLRSIQLVGGVFRKNCNYPVIYWCII